jgi:hypothetical protein
MDEKIEITRVQLVPGVRGFEAGLRPAVVARLKRRLADLEVLVLRRLDQEGASANDEGVDRGGDGEDPILAALDALRPDGETLADSAQSLWNADEFIPDADLDGQGTELAAGALLLAVCAGLAVERRVVLP